MERPADLIEPEPRAYTVEEMRRTVMGHIKMTMEYWIHADLAPVGSAEDKAAQVAYLEMKGDLRYRMEGFVHSLLVMFDGCASGVPALDLVPSPHEDDQKYHQDNGENWWVAEIINECQLHDMWHEFAS